MYRLQDKRETGINSALSTGRLALVSCLTQVVFLPLALVNAGLAEQVTTATAQLCVLSSGHLRWNETVVERFPQEEHFCFGCSVLSNVHEHPPFSSSSCLFLLVRR